MSRRRFSEFDPEPHGTDDLIRYYLRDVIGTRRRYGRRMIARVAAGCDEWSAADAFRARIRHLHRVRQRGN